MGSKFDSLVAYTMRRPTCIYKHNLELSWIKTKTKQQDFSSGLIKTAPYLLYILYRPNLPISDSYIAGVVGC